MSSCPFAFFRHDNGTDSKPSFGISTSSPSRFHCFTCGAKGLLTSIPAMLEFNNVEVDQSVIGYILDTETYDYKDYDDAPIEIPDVIESRFLKTFSKIPKSVQNELGVTEGVIEKYNLLYDPIQERLVVPIWDSRNRLVGVRARYTGSDLYIMKDYKFLQYRGSTIKANGVWYNEHAPLSPTKPLVLVEGESDLWALDMFGYPNKWASLGASLTTNQIKQVQQITLPVIVFFDNDTAGDTSARRIADKLKSLTNVYKVQNYFKRKDVKELYDAGLLHRALNSLIKITS